ncbi:MAG: MOSC domain-containing protein [Dehalococcoidia bacterium]
MADVGDLSVTGLFRYPIKSCGGVALAEASVGSRGIIYDREFMVVDATTGLFLTQREIPRMALIRPSVEDDRLCLDAPGMSHLSVNPIRHGSARSVIVWLDRCPAVDQDPEAAGWLSDFLKTDCRLVRMAEEHVRRVDRRYAVNVGDQVGFADGYPFLLISEESLADLNAQLSSPLPMNRFRPNIVVSGGGAPYLEDQWRQIRIGAIDFHLVKACARCVITTTDQATGERGKEPLTTLAGYRRSRRGVLFGQNMVHSGPGTIRCGDPVEVLA